MEEFRAFYDSGLRPSLEKFEERRKGICRKLFLTGGVVLVVGGAVVAFLVSSGATQGYMIAVAVIGAVIIGLTWWLSTRGFVSDFKHQIVNDVVKFCDPSLTYSPAGHISQQQFRTSDIFKHSIDRFNGEDLVSGEIGKTRIRFSELHAEYKTTSTDSKGRRQTHWHTIFKGMYFIADFNKHFKGQTVVLPDSAEKLFGFLGKKLQSMNLSRDQLIKLEDPEFEKLFVVYGTDQIEARYILSSSLMKRISDFKKRLGAQLYLSFTRSNVHIAISQARNMFEPRIFRTLLDFELVREYLEDLQLAVGIVDDLNLNLRIWTKE